jgi:hypothetical protein
LQKRAILNLAENTARSAENVHGAKDAVVFALVYPKISLRNFTYVGISIEKLLRGEGLG